MGATHGGKGDDYRPVDRVSYDSGHERIWPVPDTDCAACRLRLAGGHVCEERGFGKSEKEGVSSDAGGSAAEPGGRDAVEPDGSAGED